MATKSLLTTCGQNVEANVTDSHRLLQAELEDRNLLFRTFLAEDTSAVATMVLAVGDGELVFAFKTELGLNPRRFLVQDVQELVHKLLGGDWMIEDADAFVVVCSNCSAVFD